VHLKGKKHLKTIQALRKEMREEDAILAVSDDTATQGIVTPDLGNFRSSSEVESTLVLTKQDNTCQSDSKTLDGDQDRFSTLNDIQTDVNALESNSVSNIGIHDVKTNLGKEDGEIDTDVELDREISKLLLSLGKKERVQTINDTKPKIGAAKAKRQKKAEKQAALEAEGKANLKPHKSRKPYDPSAAVQKARGETATTGRRGSKK
jgi:hypothetical protein